jgi:hypothetical protein
MSDEIKVYHCQHIGVAGTTAAHVKRKDDGTYEARIGIALMGATNMDEEGFKACNYDPFHERFYDNYAAGDGATEEEAIAAMKADMRSLANSLWY